MMLTLSLKIRVLFKSSGLYQTAIFLLAQYIPSVSFRRQHFHPHPLCSIGREYSSLTRGYPSSPAPWSEPSWQHCKASVGHNGNLLADLFSLTALILMLFNSLFIFIMVNLKFVNSALFFTVTVPQLLCIGVQVSQIFNNFRLVFSTITENGTSSPQLFCFCFCF